MAIANLHRMTPEERIKALGKVEEKAPEEPQETKSKKGKN